MDLLHRLIDKAKWLTAGLIGAMVASWWSKDYLTDWRAWAIFLVIGVACSLHLKGMVCVYHRVSLSRRLMTFNSELKSSASSQ